MNDDQLWTFCKKNLAGNMSLLEDFTGIVRPLFIETGTHEGNTLANAIKVFERCKSIEYNSALFVRACKRFNNGLDPHFDPYPGGPAHVPFMKDNVAIYQGHSPQVLPQIIEPDVPTTFWLDAHYFGNGDSISPYGQCPLKRELEVIASRPWTVKPIVLIDDAHMFDDSIPHPGSIYPFWKSNESGHDMYRRQDWPRVEELDDIMVGYKRSMHFDHIMRYDAV